MYGANSAPTDPQDSRAGRSCDHHFNVDAVSNWKLQAAAGVSADGTVIVGRGRNPSGQQEAFRAVLQTVTESREGF